MNYTSKTFAEAMKILCILQNRRQPFFITSIIGHDIWK